MGKAFAKPELYALNPDSSEDVVLKGMRCECGHVAFPYQIYGCEQCGQTDTVAPVDLSARGIVTACVLVHMHFGDYPKSPFMVGTVKLDDGPMIRTYLHDMELAPGMSVVGRFIEMETADDSNVVDLQFELVV